MGEQIHCHKGGFQRGVRLKPSGLTESWLKLSSQDVGEVAGEDSVSYPATETGDLRRRHHKGKVGDLPHGEEADIDAAVVGVALTGGGGPIGDEFEGGEGGGGAGGGPFIS